MKSLTEMAEKRKIQIFCPLTHILVTITEQRKATEIYANLIFSNWEKMVCDKRVIWDSAAPPVGVSLSFCTPLYSRCVWCRPRPQGEPWVDVHSFLLDLKRSLLFFLSLFFFFQGWAVGIPWSKLCLSKGRSQVTLLESYLWCQLLDVWFAQGKSMKVMKD